MSQIICAKGFAGRRLIERRVNEKGFANDTAALAKHFNSWQIRVTHGGSVANAYGYPAITEAVLAVSDPYGNCVYWTSRLPANKVTDRGAANACLFPAGDLFDARVTDESRRQNAMEYLEKIHQQYFPPMIVIASAIPEEVE